MQDYVIDKIVQRLQGDALVSFMKIMMNRDIEMEDDSCSENCRMIEDYHKEVKEWILDGNDNEVSNKCSKIINFTPKYLKYNL